MRILYTLIAFAVLSVSAFGQNSQCSGNAKITITASGTTAVIPAAGTRNIHICKVTFAGGGPVNFKFIATNGGGDTDKSGVYQSVQYYAYDFTGDLSMGAGNGFGINISTVATIGGLVTYYLSAN